jgi:hypothetical protein
MFTSVFYHYYYCIFHLEILLYLGLFLFYHQLNFAAFTFLSLCSLISLFTNAMNYEPFTELEEPSPDFILYFLRVGFLFCHIQLVSCGLII